MSSFDIGFHTDHVIAMEISESGRQKAIGALSSDPGVDKLGAASSVPLGGQLPTLAASSENGSSITVANNNVSPNYFEVLGIPLQRGRNFTEQEAAGGAPVAILSAGAAALLFPNQDPLGQTLRVDTPSRVVRVIGIAHDVMTCCIAYGKDPALLYLPSTASKTANVLVRVRGEVEAERNRLERQLGTVARVQLATSIRSISIARWASTHFARPQ